MANLNQLNLKILGEESVTLMNQTISWTPKDKIENTYVISSLDIAKSIDYSGLSTVRNMTFYGTGNYIVSITASGSTIDYETQDFFVMSPSEAMMATITDISISTTASSSITVSARIYGTI